MLVVNCSADTIYTEDVVLVDIYKRQCSGLQSYKTVFRGLRALGNLLCRGIDLHVVRMRQTGPENLDIEYVSFFM